MNDEEKKDSDITIKLLLIGNAFVGKTLITQKELINKKLTIISIDKWLNDWLAQFGFIEENCFLRVMSRESD